mmetsp:Transcript_35625/g.79214  ORF Transcript_35625/g.79214 Transcript_35625/m.79214 type:complete len:215 (-) Transcript_35625:1126-1770(-)
MMGLSPHAPLPKPPCCLSPVPPPCCTPLPDSCFCRSSCCSVPCWPSRCCLRSSALALSPSAGSTNWRVTTRASCGSTRWACHLPVKAPKSSSSHASRSRAVALGPGVSRAWGQPSGQLRRHWLSMKPGLFLHSPLLAHVGQPGKLSVHSFASFTSRAHLPDSSGMSRAKLRVMSVALLPALKSSAATRPPARGLIQISTSPWAYTFLACLARGS